jgi:hypothetical protein
MPPATRRFMESLNHKERKATLTSLSLRSLRPLRLKSSWER